MHPTLLSRIEGLFIVVNTLLPIIIAALLSIALSLTWQSAKQSVLKYSHSLEQIVHQAKVAKLELQKASEDIAEMAENIQKNGTEIVTKVNNMTTSFGRTIDGFGNVFEEAVEKLSLDIKIPVIKKVVPIKFGKVLAKPMKAIGDSIAKPFKPLGNSLSELGTSVGEIKSELAAVAKKLEEIKKMDIYLDAVIEEYQSIIVSLQEMVHTISKLFRWLAIGFISLCVWFFFSYLLWARRRLINGITLLKGAH